MSDFWLYYNLGLRHVLNLNGFDHALFIIALTAPYTFKSWKKVFLLLTLFTIGHTISLILATYEIVPVTNEALVELLLQLTILIAAIHNFFVAKKQAVNENISVIAFTALAFGIIHGFGFSRYFRLILKGSGAEYKLPPLLEFAAGIETAHITVAFAVLIISFVLQFFFRLSKKDWVLVVSSFVAGVIVPMIINNEIW